jgi:hypothetical protein
MNMISKKVIKNWMDANVIDHTVKGEVNMTSLGEECAAHFGVLSETGNSSDEELIFEIASEYFSG